MNPFARPPACSACGDTRKLTRSVKAHDHDIIPCHKCGTLTDEEYERFRMDAWVKSHPMPELCEVDLTPEEFVVFGRLRAEHPKVSKTTVLAWMEGQRYDPSKDPEFLKEVEIEMEKWRNRP